MKTRQLCYTALFAALTAVCSQIAIPTPWQIPISLATLAVFLSGALLGAKWGTAAQLVYLLLGMVGAPVFAGFRGAPNWVANVLPNSRIAASASCNVLPDEPTSNKIDPLVKCRLNRCLRRLIGRINPGYVSFSAACNVTA